MGEFSPLPSFLVFPEGRYASLSLTVINCYQLFMTHSSSQTVKPLLGAVNLNCGFEAATELALLEQSFSTSGS